MRTPQIARELVGKTIARVDLHPFSNGRGGTAYDPVLVFTDGTRLGFLVDETETDYGVSLRYIESRRSE